MFEELDLKVGERDANPNRCPGVTCFVDCTGMNCLWAVHPKPPK